MKLDAIALVSESIDFVMQDADRASALFYGRLLTLDPALCALFPDDFATHGHRILKTVQQIINGLQAPETIMPVIRQTSRAHHHFGVQPHHYQPFGEAFFWMLREIHGLDYTAELAQVWEEAYCLMAGLMKEAEGG